VRGQGEEGQPGALARLLAALGLGMSVNEAVDDEEGLPLAAPDNRWLRLQWLFWVLALSGYACLVVALIVLLPGGAGFLDEARNPLGKQALVVGLVASIGAWWLARKLAAKR
jgi:hypothetical protein